MYIFRLLYICFIPFFHLGKDVPGGSDDNDSVINDNASVVSNASADSYMKDIEGNIYLNKWGQSNLRATTTFKLYLRNKASKMK